MPVVLYWFYFGSGKEGRFQIVNSLDDCGDVEMKIPKEMDVLSFPNASLGGCPVYSHVLRSHLEGHIKCRF